MNKRQKKNFKKKWYHKTYFTDSMTPPRLRKLMMKHGVTPMGIYVNHPVITREEANRIGLYGIKRGGGFVLYDSKVGNKLSRFERPINK